MSRYYVYAHDDGKCFYIGYGIGDRAWSVGNRDVEHKKYLMQLIEDGLTPPDWVELLWTNLTKEKAREIEAKTIEKFIPLFNRNDKYRGLKFDKDCAKQARQLRADGFSYSKIAKQLGFSTMTVHRALTGVTRAHA